MPSKTVSVRLTPEILTKLDTLAAACAETGHFDQALATAQKAQEMAQAAGQKDLTAQLERRIELYRARQPVRD